MQTLALISQKGGAGKTTVALHLAVAFVKTRRNTAVIDLDPQASAANWADRRESELPVVISAHASRLHHEIRRVEDAGCQVLVLDTAPHSDHSAIEVAKTADLILMPCRPAILDMEAISSTLDLMQTTGKPVYVVLNATTPQGHEAEEAAEALGELDVQVCPVQLVNRVAFARSLISGQTAQEIEPNGKAAREVERLHGFIRGCLDHDSPEQESEAGGISANTAAQMHMFTHAHTNPCNVAQKR